MSKVIRCYLLEAIIAVALMILVSRGIEGKLWEYCILGIYVFLLIEWMEIMWAFLAFLPGLIKGLISFFGAPILIALPITLADKFFNDNTIIEIVAILVSVAIGAVGLWIKWKMVEDI